MNNKEHLSIWLLVAFMQSRLEAGAANAKPGIPGL